MIITHVEYKKTKKCKMKKRFRIAILFSILLFAEFEIYSEEKEFRSLSAYCQWGPAQYSSRKACTERCEKFKGFKDPNSTQLVCFQDSKEASVIIDEEANNKLQCGYQADGSPDRACNPTITCEYRTYERCVQKCSKYTVYLTRFKNRYVDISYCGETSKIERRIVKLDSKATKFSKKRKDETEKTVFDCSCGIGEEGTEEQPTRKKETRLMQNKDAPNEMIALCPNILQRFSKKACETSCGYMNGIYSQIDGKFICFQSEKDVTVMKATTEYCECGTVASDYEEKVLKNRNSCPPDRNIQLNDGAEEKDCPGKCANYKAYVFSQNQFEPDTIYCEFPSYIFRNLSYEIGKTVVGESKGGNKKYRKYECTCGLRPSKTEMNSKINNSLNVGRTEVKNNLQTSKQSDTRSDVTETSEQRYFSEFNVIRDDEIEDLIRGNEFLYDLILDGENTNNNNNDLDVPTVGEKRTSRQTNLSDFDEINRSKKKGTDKIIRPADLKIPAMSFDYTVSPPNNTQINGTSSSSNEGFNRNIRRQNSEEMFQT